MKAIANLPTAQPVGDTWFVVVAESQQEPLAAAGLQARRFACYFPTYPKRVGSNYGNWRIVHRPMLPGYLFASFDPNENGWKSISAVAGIRRILMADERPIPVPEAALWFIRAREAQMQADFGTGKRRFVIGHKIGDWVQVCDHASFGGLFGRVIQLLAEKGKLVLEIELLSRKTRVELPAHSVRAV